LPVKICPDTVIEHLASVVKTVRNRFKIYKCSCGAFHVFDKKQRILFVHHGTLKEIVKYYNAYVDEVDYTKVLYKVKGWKTDGLKKTILKR